MKNFLILLLLAIFCTPYCWAQTPREVPTDFPTVGDVNIIAIRVEFQEDNNDSTTGNGKMNTETVDPPHNKAYFMDQLDNMIHYFETVSYGKLNLHPFHYPAVDSCYTLSQDMPYYTDPEVWDLRINQLFKEAIQLADDDIDFSSFDLERTAVMVIHAGAPYSTNRIWTEEVDGYTPLDMQSAFLPPSDFLNYLGGEIQTADGVELDRGMVLPETASQDEVLSGLLGIWAQIFGYQLGLPALFDTQLGEPRIGAWGLMDMGANNYRGFSPAHPCAWSKVRMGWVEPRVINFAESKLCTLRASEIYPEMIKIPITSTEYFLLENRETDPNNDEIPNIDEYDFSIPGSGLLIWHIDEEVIEAGLDYNTVNANPERKGVDLEEADGIQDFDGYTGDYFSTGFYQDAFFDGNNDRFDSASIPNTKSNSDAETHISVYDISEFGPQMTFKIDIDWKQDGWVLENDDPILPNSLNYCDLDEDGNVELLYITLDSDRVYHLNLLEKSGEVTIICSSNSEILPPAVDRYKVWVADRVGNVGYYELSGYYQVADYNGMFPVGPALYYPHQGDEGELVLLSLQKLYLGENSVEFGGIPSAPAVCGQGILTVSWAPGGNAITYKRFNFDLEIVASQDYVIEDGSETISDIATDGVSLSAFSVDSLLYVIDMDGNIKEGFPIHHNAKISSPIIAQYDNDLVGTLEIFVMTENGTQLYCWQDNGIIMEGFPKTFTDDSFANDFISAGCAVNNGRIFGTVAGANIMAWEGSKELEGSPFAFSGANQEISSPLLLDMDSDNDMELIILSGKNQLIIYDMPYGILEQDWQMYRSDQAHSGCWNRPPAPDMIPITPSSYVDRNSFYAYPNPIVGEEARIRYQLLKIPNKKPVIKVFDLSGDLITEMEGSGTGAYNEIVWDVRDIASGVYICRLQVEDEVEFCKIAITK